MPTARANRNILVFSTHFQCTQMYTGPSAQGLETATVVAPRCRGHKSRGTDGGAHVVREDGEGGAVGDDACDCAIRL